MKRILWFLLLLLCWLQFLCACKKTLIVEPTITTIPATSQVASTQSVVQSTEDLPATVPSAIAQQTTVPPAATQVTTDLPSVVPTTTIPATTMPLAVISPTAIPTTTAAPTTVPTAAASAMTVPPTTAATVPTVSESEAIILPTAAAFEAKQYILPNEGVIRYWLYVPENVTLDMPLIVYLHGGSGKGDDLSKITAVDGLPQYLQQGRISPQAYVLIPQVSSVYKGWGDMKADLMKLITAVKNEYAIDDGRIGLTGHSMGGTGTWQIALAYPGTFAAIAPLSGSVPLTEQNIAKLKKLPVWAVVGAEDTVVDPQSSIDFINALSAVNANAKLTVLENTDHFTVPSVSYLTTGLIDWLVSQSK